MHLFSVIELEWIMIQHSTLRLSPRVIFIDEFTMYIYMSIPWILFKAPTAVVRVPVTELSVVTHKTHVDTGVLDTVRDVIKAGTTVGERLAIGAPFAELLPIFAVLGKRKVMSNKWAFEDFVYTVMKAQNLDWHSFGLI